MLKRVLVVTVTLVASTVGLRSASAQSPVLDRILTRGEIRVATSGTQPPFNAISKDGQLMGLEIDLIRAIAEAMNVNLNLRSMPFPDLLPALREGKVDMVLSGLSITPQRIKEFAFVGPYVLSGKSVLTDSATLVNMKTPRDLDRPALTLTALAGSTSAEYVTRVAPQAKLVTTQSYDEAIQMLLAKEADAMIADMPVCVLTVLKNPRADLATPSQPFNIEPVGIAIRANDERFRNLLELYIEAFESTGVLEEMRREWLEGGDWVIALP
jgi:polar amino acid transport system substrate-binding protein